METIDYSNKCFVMMPISNHPDYPTGHFDKIYSQIFVEAIKEAGYEAYRVDENQLSDPIMVNIFDAIQKCPIAICDLSSKNPNVLYELGLRQAYDKPVILVQDEKTDRIFDVSGINTYTYQSNRVYENIISARESIKNALNETKNNADKSWSLIKLLKTREAVLQKEEVTDENKEEFLLKNIMHKLDNLSERVDEIAQNDYYEYLEKGKLDNDINRIFTTNKMVADREVVDHSNKLSNEEIRKYKRKEKLKI